MAERNERVLQQIQDELRVRPDLSLGVLYQFAVHADPTLEGIKLRQFNVTYVLPAKQRIAAEARRPPRRPRKKRTQARQAPGNRVAGNATAMEPVSSPPPARSSATAGEQPTADAPSAEPTVPVSTDPGTTSTDGEAAETPATPQAGVEAEAEAPSRRPSPEANVKRAKVRAALMSFAQDLAAAEGRVELVRVLTRVDGYIDRLRA